MSMSSCIPSGIRTPMTFSLPSASTQRAAVTELSFPPEIPMTALQPSPLFLKKSRIHKTHFCAVTSA